MDATWKQARIAELERQLAEAVEAAQGENRGSSESARAQQRIAELSAELGALLQTGAPHVETPYVEAPYAETPYVETPRYPAFSGFMGGSRYRSRRLLPLLVGGPIIIVIMGVGAFSVIASRHTGDTGGMISAPSQTPEPAVTTVPSGGKLRVGASLGQKRVVDCNDGNLTLYGTGIFSITGHCASLSAGALNSQVSVEAADIVNITNSDTSYFIAGHVTSLTVTSSRNKVTVDRVDAINIEGTDNTVTYKSGSPQVSDTGVGNDVVNEE